MITPAWVLLLPSISGYRAASECPPLRCAFPATPFSLSQRFLAPARPPAPHPRQCIQPTRARRAIDASSFRGDRLDEAGVVVLDVAHAAAERPARHLLRLVMREHSLGAVARPQAPPRATAATSRDRGRPASRCEARRTAHCMSCAPYLLRRTSAQKSCDKIILRINASEAAVKPWPTPNSTLKGSVL